MKKKIINIMSNSPAYEFFWNDPRPEINWNTPDGEWVGIWGLDIPDLLGTEILKLTNEFVYEVWQPDLRADRVYSHTFTSGLTRRNFPAANRATLFGAKWISKTYSKIMIRELARQSREGRIILHLNGSPLSYKYLMNLFGHLPIIFDFRGTIFLPFTRLSSRTKNVPSKVHHLLDHYWLKKNVSKTDCIVYRNSKNIQYLRRIYDGVLQKLTSGCNFSFWRPGDKAAARDVLGLPKGKKVFFTASRLVAGKQIEKIISVFSELADTYDFLLVIAGHGLQAYEDCLKNLSLDLLKKKKIRFVGFLSGEKFRSYYNASDFFLLTSTSEGASVAVMNAFACEVPVISTRTGHTAELMEQYHCGCLLDIHDSEMWRNEIQEILEGKKVVKLMDREIAKKHYDWPNVAIKFKDIYESLVQKYYS